MCTNGLQKVPLNKLASKFTNKGALSDEKDRFIVSFGCFIIMNVSLLGTKLALCLSFVRDAYSRRRSDDWDIIRHHRKHHVDFIGHFWLLDRL